MPSVRLKYLNPLLRQFVAFYKRNGRTVVTLLVRGRDPRKYYSTQRDACWPLLCVDGTVGSEGERPVFVSFLVNRKTKV